jgi:hypothetical protein
MKKSKKDKAELKKFKASIVYGFFRIEEQIAHQGPPFLASLYFELISSFPRQLHHSFTRLALSIHFCDLIFLFVLPV